jgi:hypothetical protein
MVVQRSKEQIAQGMKNIQEVKRMRAFVKDTFYPQLILASTSIDDAKYLLTSFSNMVMEQFLTLMKEKKFAELNLKDKLDPKLPQYEEFVKLLDLFNDETVFSARELIEGMNMEIQTMINNELKERKLDSLKTNFLE